MTLVLIGISALFWGVDRLENRGHLGSRYLDLVDFYGKCR